MAHFFKRGLIVALVLALSGCFGSKTGFDQDFNADGASISGQLSGVTINEATALFPEAKMIRSQPSDKEIAYTFPGDEAGKDMVVLFTFNPIGNGTGTKLHVDVTVPEIRAMIDGKPKVVNRDKVKSGLQKAIRNLAEAMNKHESTMTAKNELQQVFTALAIISHKSTIAKMAEYSKNPSAAFGRLLEAMGDGGFDEGDSGPEFGEAREGFGDARRGFGDAKDVRPMNDAEGKDIETMSEPQGYDPTPEDSGPSQN